MSHFYDLCRRYPPPMVRLLARSHGKAMTTAQIAASTGSTQLAVETLSCEPSWDRVTLDQLRRFTGACGIDFSNPRDINRIECYWRKNGGHPRFRYLTSAPDWRSYYLPFILAWRRSVGEITEALPIPIHRLLESLKV